MLVSEKKYNLYLFNPFNFTAVKWHHYISDVSALKYVCM